MYSYDTAAATVLVSRGDHLGTAGGGGPSPVHVMAAILVNGTQALQEPIYDHSLMNNTGHIINPHIENTDLDADQNCKNFTFIIYVPIFGLLCLIGLVGNSLSLLVLQWEKRNHVATFLLQSLAMSDNLFLLTTGFVQIFSALALYFEWSAYEVALPYLQTYIWPLVHITQFGTIWMTVLIAANRYIAICKPFQAPKLCTLSIVRAQVISVTLVALLYNIPRFLEYKVTYTFNPATNQTLIRGSETSLKLDPMYNIVYENALYCFFIFLGPLVILIVLNVCLVRELMAARKRLIKRQIPIPGEEEENNLTLVMIVIMLIFVLTQAPAFLNQLLFYILSDSGYICGRAYYYFFHLSNLLVSANSSTNFFVYFVFRAQFRERLRAFCNSYGIALKHTDTWDYQGRTMSVYTKSGGPGDAL